MSRRVLLSVDLRNPLTSGQFYETVTEKLKEAGFDSSTPIIFDSEVGEELRSIRVRIYAINE